jgi:hypothetical protein
MLAFATPLSTFAGKSFLAIAGGYIDVGEEAVSDDNFNKTGSMWEDKINQVEQENISVIKNKIPEGGTYYIGSTSNQTGDYTGATKVYNAGESLPEDYEPQTGDVFVFGDYEYKYNYYWEFNGNEFWSKQTSQNGWGVRVLDRTKTSYGKILKSITDKPITSIECTFVNCTSLITGPAIPNSSINMSRTFLNCSALTNAPSIPDGITDLQSTFAGCTSLTTAPKIPQNVSNMSCTFSECSSLIEAPEIPSSVRNMSSTFSRCTSLTTTPTIPNGVTDMTNTFAYCSGLKTVSTIPSSVEDVCRTFFGCTSLTGTIEINTNPPSYNDCFKYVDFEANNLTLIGSSVKMDLIGATGKNYCSTCNGYCTNSH